MYARFFKRVMDIVLAVIAILILAVPMLVIALIIRINDPKGCVIFRQTRVGRNDTRFKIFKFRTMDSATPKHLPSNCFSAEEYEKHVTRVGRFLRRSSLDELPQVFNILRGDMSFVGPRPILAKETLLLEAREKAGLRSFRPGLTGWAQVNGRNTLTDEEKAAYDAQYIERVSPWFDLCCIVRTLYIAITKKGFLEGSMDRLDQHADFEEGDEFFLPEITELTITDMETRELRPIEEEFAQKPRP